jgi:crotonobetainyl-CoA:carnitine CoA-transferase CaiB-like acyl-CoA transferase
VSYLWEVTNRGKRAIAVDIHAPDGREIILSLAEESDVFLTNFLPSALSASLASMLTT